MKEAFIHKKFSDNPDAPFGSIVLMIERANKVIAEYKKDGYTLTLRQLYYQFVARDWFPNKIESYKNLGRVVREAREAGLIDWNAIEDRTRYVRSLDSWDDPNDFMSYVSGWYQENLWAGQGHRPIVWIEKDAVVGVIEDVCNEYMVPFFSCRGYNSSSAIYRAAKQIQNFDMQGLTPVILHFGDHDPSGVDMSRDNAERLKRYSHLDELEFRRLALTMKQVQRYQCPPQPVKETDVRARGYQEQHGDECWELDALKPAVIKALIKKEIEKLINKDVWDEAKAAEAANKKLLEAASERWDEIEDLLKE